jgi:PhoH-like ATPase
MTANSPIATTERKIFIIDTNVPLIDPYCICRFEEHDIVLPFIVLDEIDAHKKGHSENARNARIFNHYIDQLVGDHKGDVLESGVPIVAPRVQGNGYEDITSCALGKLSFLYRIDELIKFPGFDQSLHDHVILQAMRTTANTHPQRNVTLITRDVNLRVKARVLGMNAEDYASDRVIEDDGLIHSGICILPDGFWSTQSSALESKTNGRYAEYLIEHELVKDWYPCMFVQDQTSGMELMVVEKTGPCRARVRTIDDFRKTSHAQWGITARNFEQNCALSLLRDPDIDCAILDGVAGTGKTLLTLAVGLALTLDEKMFREIVMTREVVSMGEEIGFLPGNEEEKVTPWMGALLDNLELLGSSQAANGFEKIATNALLMNRVKVRALSMMRGRSIMDRFLILDEAQNCTVKQMEAFATRVAKGTKIVILGNNGQIDTPYLTPTTSGLTWAIERFRDCTFAGHVTLKRGERSRIAEYLTS